MYFLFLRRKKQSNFAPPISALPVAGGDSVLAKFPRDAGGKCHITFRVDLSYSSTGMTEDRLSRFQPIFLADFGSGGVADLIG